jgi:hypothetical protein
LAILFNLFLLACAYCVIIRQLESNPFLLANGNIAWATTIVPQALAHSTTINSSLAKIGASGTNAWHWGYLLLVDCCNMRSIYIMDRWNLVYLVLLGN